MRRGEESEERRGMRIAENKESEGEERDREERR